MGCVCAGTATLAGCLTMGQRPCRSGVPPVAVSSGIRSCCGSAAGAAMSTRTAIRAARARAAGCRDTPNPEGVGLLVVVPKPRTPRAISAVSRRLRARCPPKRTLQRYVVTSPNHLPCTRSHNSGGVPHDLEGTHPEGKQRSTFYVRTFSAQPPTYSSVNVPQGAVSW
jgi:hypothetical protein